MRKNLFVTSILLFTFSSLMTVGATIGQTLRTADEYNNRGLEKQRQGDIDNAIADFNRALAIDPGNPLAYANRCVSNTKKGMFTEALADCNKALSLNPRFVEAYVFRGDLRADMEQLEPAIADYTKAIEIDGKFARAYLGRGMAQIDKGNPAGAFADFDKAIVLEPKYAEAYATRGLALLAQGRDAEAEKDLQRAIEIDPRIKDAIREVADDIRSRRGTAGAKDDNGVLNATTEKNDLYPAGINAQQEIADALKLASRDQKRVMLIFGANWCYDCHVLDRALHEGAAGQIVKERFLLVHVDIGEADKNLDLAKKYKIPLEKGVPAVVVLAANGQMLYSSGDGEFEAARRMMKKDLVAFLTKWRTGQ